MSYPNRDGPQGTVTALRQSNPAVFRGLIGPDAGATEGMQDQPGTGPGAGIDAALADLDGRVTALETGGAA